MVLNHSYYVIYFIIQILFQEKNGRIIISKPQKHDFFTLIRELFISGLKFAADNPEIALMGN